MKKQKLHRLATFAAISLVGAFPLFGLGQASAQQVIPPIVQGKPVTAKPSYSYTGAESKPLAPVLIGSKQPVVPPVISGKQLSVASTNSNLLSPIGSGIKQVKGTLDPKRVARAFSPATIPVRTQGSSTRNITTPAIQIPAPSGISSLQPSSVLQDSSPISQPFPSPPVISGSLVTQNTVPSVISGPAPAVVGPNYFDAGPATNQVALPSVVSGCSDCGGGGCDSCSAGNPNVNPNQVNCDYGTFGSVSAARRYAYLEFLYLTREDGDVNNSNFNPLGQFDFSPAWRFTIGQRPDMTQGREFSYFGTSGIDTTQVTNDSNNRLNALFSAAGGLIPADLSASTMRHSTSSSKKRTFRALSSTGSVGVGTY